MKNVILICILASITVIGGAVGAAVLLLPPAPVPAAGPEAAPLADPPVDLPNPAAAHCEEMGWGYEISTDPDGSRYGVCILPNGTERDAWEVYYGAHPDCLPPSAGGDGRR